LITARWSEQMAVNRTTWLLTHLKNHTAPRRS
jgi:hypothetical protein